MSKHITIPGWATHIVVHTNNIDGSAPKEETLEVRVFIDKQREIFARHKQVGRGEWDAIIYAIAKKVDGYVPLFPWRRHIYGPENPYCILNGTPKIRLSKLASWSYMDMFEEMKVSFG